jgi:hypothetical protein
VPASVRLRWREEWNAFSKLLELVSPSKDQPKERPAVS